MSIVTMRKFGQMGRFGNQLFQYMWLKTYSQRHALQLQLPRWVGNYLFATGDPPISNFSLPMVGEARLKRHADQVFRDVDVEGYFQWPTAYFAPNKEYIRSLFRPVELIERQLLFAVEELHAHNPFVIGLHIRRGDYGVNNYYRVPTSWYKRAIQSLLNIGGDRQVRLFIASDDPHAHEEFQDVPGCNVVTASQLKAELTVVPHSDYNYLNYELANRTFDFYPEFYLLQQCDVLLIPNSTFSFAAAMLNRRMRLCLRSDLPSQSFLTFDPWDAEPLQHGIDVADYPDCGVRMSVEELREHHGPIADSVLKKWGVGA